MDKFEIVKNFIESITNDKIKPNKGFNGEYFCDKKFYLDETCLCKVTDNAVYISKNMITPKCSSYLSELKSSLQRFNMPILSIPQWYGFDTRTHEFDEKDIIASFYVELNQLKGNVSIYSKIHLEELLGTLELINEKCFVIPNKLIEEVNNVIQNMCDIINPENNEVKKFIEETDYYELVRIAYFSNEKSMSFRTELKKYLNPSGEFAFLNYNDNEGIWYSSETLCGLPKATMNFEEGWGVLKAYHDGTARHGVKFGKYIVMKVTDGYIKISCNKYCKKLFEACYQYILNKYIC